MTDDKKEETPKEEPTKKEAPIQVMDLPNVNCQCGGMIWEYAFIMKRIDNEKTGKKNIPVDIIICKKCGSVLQDGVQVLSRSIKQEKGK